MVPECLICLPGSIIYFFGDGLRGAKDSKPLQGDGVKSRDEDVWRSSELACIRKFVLKNYFSHLTSSGKFFSFI